MYRDERFIIEQIRETGGAGVTELARRTDLHKSTVHSHLRTLVQCGYLVKEDDVYRLSLRFLAHGGRVRNDMEIYQGGVSVIRNLASESGELANLGGEENRKLVVIFMTEGENAVHDLAPAGKYTDMHSTAMGKAILAHLPRERTERIIERHGLPARTENTITDRAALSSELEQIPRRRICDRRLRGAYRDQLHRCTGAACQRHAYQRSECDRTDKKTRR